MKLLAANLIANYLLPIKYDIKDPFDILCRNVTRFYSGKISQNDLTCALFDYFEKINSETIKYEFNFKYIKSHLINNNGYKFNINDKKNLGILSRLNIQNRKLAIMQQLGMKLDVIIMRQNEYIPPHAHKRMVSGFYVLEGLIGVRHYDIAKEDKSSMLIKKTLDKKYSTDEFTTNSDTKDNIHWLKGIENESFLFRVSIINRKKEQGRENMGAKERIYINPTPTPNSQGLINATYISEETAKSLSFPS